MIKAIAFDLDDTLLNTSEILIPSAILQIYDLLTPLGYSASFADFNSQRIAFVSHSSHRDFFKDLVLSNPQLAKNPDLTPILIDKFYQPAIPKQLPLIEGARENLNYLKSKYFLFIVTSGIYETQKKKIDALNLTQWIAHENHFIVDGTQIKNKKQAFQNILDKLSIPPSQLLSFGNRLSQEIRMAKELGARTCYFKFGEHAKDVPLDHFEVPDYTIQTQNEFITTCRL